MDNKIYPFYLIQLWFSESDFPLFEKPENINKIVKQIKPFICSFLVVFPQIPRAIVANAPAINPPK